MFLLHRNTVFNSDTHASKVLRPAVIIRDVNTPIQNGQIPWRERAKEHSRFDRHALPRPQNLLPRITRRIMDVETDIMAQVVREKGFERLATSVSNRPRLVRLDLLDCCFRYLAGHIEAQPRQIIPQSPLCDLVHFIERQVCTGATKRDAGALDGEDGVVEVALGFGECGADGEGAGYVGDVVAVFLGKH